jgi:hypothetical protein
MELKASHGSERTDHHNGCFKQSSKGFLARVYSHVTVTQSPNTEKRSKQERCSVTRGTLMIWHPDNRTSCVIKVGWTLDYVSDELRAVTLVVRNK